MRKYIDIINEEFAEKSASAPFKMPPRELMDSDIRADVDTARQYDTADEYADALNPIHVMNTDPPQLHDRYERERVRLKNRWEYWKEMGYITPAPVGPRRFGQRPV